MVLWGQWTSLCSESYFCSLWKGGILLLTSTGTTLKGNDGTKLDWPLLVTSEIQEIKCFIVFYLTTIKYYSLTLYVLYMFVMTVKVLDLLECISGSEPLWPHGGQWGSADPSEDVSAPPRFSKDSKEYCSYNRKSSTEWEHSPSHSTIW